MQARASQWRTVDRRCGEAGNRNLQPLRLPELTRSHLRPRRRRPVCLRRASTLSQ